MGEGKPRRSKRTDEGKISKGQRNFLKSGKTRERTEEQRANKAEYDRKRKEEKGKDINQERREKYKNDIKKKRKTKRTKLSKP